MRFPLFLGVLLLISVSLTTIYAQNDDFSEFADDDAVATKAQSEGGKSSVVGDADISEFDEEEEEENPIEEDNTFDFDDDEDDGEVESVEDENLDRDSFEDFADDQIIQTEPGEKSGHPSVRKAQEKKKNSKNDGGIKFKE